MMTPRSRTLRPFLLGASLLLLAGGGIALSLALPDDPPPALPAVTPVGGVQVVYAQPFTLAAPATHAWRKEQPAYTAGVLLVLRAPVELLAPRQTAEPVLYVGAQTAERVNTGADSGMLVAIVPAALDKAGNVDLDLSRTPVFFGAPALPEQIDAETAQRELAAARRSGIAATPAAALAQALQPQVAFDDDWQLHVHAADLIERWSPIEADVITGLRAPRVGQ